jgi:hypothetical protein
MEGVDFKNVRQVHLLDPWWNDSRMQQVIGRGVRFCSHKDLPPDKRVVDVFIHLASLGTGQKVQKFKIKSSSDENPRFVYAIPKVVKGTEEVSYEEVQLTPLGELVDSEKEPKIFKKNDIMEVAEIHDTELNRAIHGWKNLDSFSVQQYMYSRAMRKLNLNKQFESAIKEVAIDCTINKNGNVSRLDEMYTPVIGIDKTWNLSYENYSTGEKYKREGVPDTFNLSQILSGVAKKSESLKFINVNGYSVGFVALQK